MKIKDLNNKLMYKDLLTVYEYGKTRNADGSTVSKLLKVANLTDIPCRLSVRTADIPDSNSELNKTHLVYTLFADNEHLIKKGSKLEVIKQGDVHKFTAGKPVKHEHHQEIVCIDEEWA